MKNMTSSRFQRSTNDRRLFITRLSAFRGVVQRVARIHLRQLRLVWDWCGLDFVEHSTTFMKECFYCIDTTRCPLKYVFNYLNKNY